MPPAGFFKNKKFKYLKHQIHVDFLYLYISIMLKKTVQIITQQNTSKRSKTHIIYV